MKTVKWFRAGEPIPDNGKYLKSENKIIRYDEAEHPMLPDRAVREEFHLYEIPAQEVADDKSV